MWAWVAAGVATACVWLFSEPDHAAEELSESSAADVEAKLFAAEKTGEKTSTLVQMLEGLPADVKQRGIAALVKADPDLLLRSADEIESFGYPDLAERLRFRADVLS